MNLLKFKISIKHCQLSLSSVGGGKGCRLSKKKERREEKTEEFLILSMEKIKQHTPKHMLKRAGEGKVLEKIGQGYMFPRMCICMYVYAVVWI